LYRTLNPELQVTDYLTIFGQYLVQPYFAASDEKRLLLSDIVQDLQVVTDMHVPTLARMLDMLQLLVLDLCELLPILSLFYSLCIVLQPHTTSQSECRLLRLIVYRLNAITAFSHKIPESEAKTIHT